MSLLVVIPAYAGDYSYALANLQRQQPCGHSALLVLDSGLSKEQCKALRAEAQEAFTHTAVLPLTLPSFSTVAWPTAANYVWQSAVRHIESEVVQWVKRKLRGWLWWEADAAPLTPDWLDTLDSVYATCGKPIMGHIVPQRGHMNGVAIYPFDMSRYAYKAMLTRATPFDVALSSECRSRIAPANELIAHVLKRQGGDAPRPLTAKAIFGMPSTCVLAHGFCHHQSHEVPQNFTTVITNHGRPEQLWRAFQSCLIAGVQNIVVVSTHLDEAVLEIHSEILKAHPETHIIAIRHDPGCTQAWLAGVQTAKTPWVHILHDDDMVLPQFAEEIGSVLLEQNVRFLLLNAQFHSGTSIRASEPLWNESEGLHDAKELQSRLLSKPRSISPVSGVFEQSFLERVLCEFQERCANRSEFQLRPTMQVGNDLLIWLRATELEGKFRYITKPLVSYGSHPGSITVADQATNANRLPTMYQAVKDYWSGKPSSTVELERCAIFCYVPNQTEALPFLNHLNRWKRSMPLHLVVHSQTSLSKVHEFKESDTEFLISTPPKFQTHGGCLPSDQYAMLAFLHILKAAIERQLTHFILIETDCRFSADYWDQKIWQEFKAWPEEALFGGTPVCWHPWSKGHDESQKIIDYAHRYQQSSGVAMAFEGAYNSQWGMAIYPNGALAIYNVSECREYLSDVLPVLDASPNKQGAMLAPFHTFDLHIGRKLVAKHGVSGALSKLAYLPSVYSGCKNHHVTLEERLAMIRTGRKVAVHHIKTSEAPWE